MSAQIEQKMAFVEQPEIFLLGVCWYLNTLSLFATEKQTAYAKSNYFYKEKR